MIKSIEIEISSTCNSWCIDCGRYYIYDHGIYNRKIEDINKNFNIDYIDRIFTSKYLYDDVFVKLIGVFGDPFFNKDLIDIVKRILELKPNSRIMIHTNGGLGLIKDYKELATIFNSNTEHYLTFSIDGLEDTNHIYRKNVKWEMVKKRFLEYNNNGGNSIWKFLIFPWNKHQIEDAKRLKDQYGFNHLVIHNARKVLDDVEYKIYDEIYDNILMTYIEKYNVKKNINAKCVEGKELFVGVDGGIYFCCDMYGELKTTCYSTEYKNKLSENFCRDGTDWYLLTNNTLDDIIEDSRFNKIYDQENLKNVNLCKMFCGE